MSLALLATNGTSFPVLGTLAVSCIVIVYVGGPLLALFTHRQAARLTASPLLSFDIVRQIDPDVATRLQAAASALTELGFVVGQPLRLPIAERSVGFAIVGEAPNGDVAESCVLIRTIEQQVIRRDWTNFHSQTRNFARTVTSNSVDASGIPSRAGHSAFSARGLKDLARLYQLHGVRVGDSGGRRRGAPPLGDQAAFVESEWVGSIENMVVRGYLRRGGTDGETCLLTAKGAFLSAWRQLPPWKNIADAKARRGLTDLEARVPRGAPLARSA